MNFVEKMIRWIDGLFEWIPDPDETPLPPPPTVPAVDANPNVTSVILGYNNGLAYWKGNINAWSIAGKGVTIHKISQAQAQLISGTLVPAAEKNDLPLTYAMACLAIESTFDPNCVNGNLGPGESNPENNPGGYDIGVAQLKLRELGGGYNASTNTFSDPWFPNVANVSDARAFALDPTRAIPYFASLMAQKITWANKTIAAYKPGTAGVTPDVRLLNPLMLATAAYNFGDTGVMTYFNNGTFPSHCQQVLDLERYFAGKLSVPSCLPPVSTTWPAGN